MKYLITLLVLINCLAYFMYSHLQQQSMLADAPKIDPLQSPKPLVLLSELTDKQLRELDPSLAEEENGGQCEYVGPFENEVLALEALELLLSGNGLPEMVTSVPEIPGYWLKIPLNLSTDIADQLWSQYESKKRYKEGCMKVANKRQFQ